MCNPTNPWNSLIFLVTYSVSEIFLIVVAKGWRVVGKMLERSWRKGEQRFERGWIELGEKLERA